MRIPVRISGRALGNITLRKICPFVAPSECEALIFDNWVPEAPVRADITMMANATINSRKIFPSS